MVTIVENEKAFEVTVGQGQEISTMRCLKRETIKVYRTSYGNFFEFEKSKCLEADIIDTFLAVYEVKLVSRNNGRLYLCRSLVEQNGEKVSTYNQEDLFSCPFAEATIFYDNKRYSSEGYRLL